jgi:hypothetical protein
MTSKQKMRVEIVRAMETIARSINDEELFGVWLMNGVADGDITETTTDEEVYTNYCEDDYGFADLMATFARLMRYVTQDEDIDEEDLKAGNGIFYVDGVVSKKGW